MHRLSLLFLAAAVSLSPRLSSQHLTEHPFPPLPYRNVSAQVVPASDAFIVQGISSASWNSVFPEWWGDVHIPFLLRWNGKRLSAPVILPDTFSSEYRGFDYRDDVWKFSVACAPNGDPLFHWSSARLFRSDVPPSFIGSVKRTFAVWQNGALHRGATDSSGLNPSLFLDPQQTVHRVWEKVTPETVYGYDRRFNRFRSDIQYKTMGLDGGEYHDIPRTVGRGFFPDIRVRNGVPYILFFAADSATSRTFALQVNRDTVQRYRQVVYNDTGIYNIFRESPVIHQKTPATLFSWDVDTAEGIHIVRLKADRFEDRRIIVEHVKGDGAVWSDSTLAFFPSYGEVFTRHRNDGEVRLALAVNGAVRYYTSVFGTPATEKKSFPSADEYVRVRAFFADRSGAEHILAENMNGKGLFLIRSVETDTAAVILLSREHTMSGGVYVDTANTAWFAGRRDSTAVLLSVDIGRLKSVPDFVFPLRKGNEWQYFVYPDPPGPFPIGRDRQRMTADTLMPNGRRYIVITSQFRQPLYLRRDGLSVFHYQPEDSTEFRVLDFSRTAGDTIVRFAPQTMPSIVLSAVDTQALFGTPRRFFTFTGGWFGTVRTADSIGIVSIGSLGPTWELCGAVINGKVYGDVLSVGEPEEGAPTHFALSQNYPNPFNPSTTISYALPQDGLTTLKVYDVLGREVAELVNEFKTTGRYTVSFDASRLSSGVYVYRLVSEKYSAVKKMLMLK